MLKHNELKCKLFSRIIRLYNNSLTNYQILCPKCVSHTQTRWLRCNATGWQPNQRSTDQTTFIHRL